MNDSLWPHATYQMGDSEHAFLARGEVNGRPWQIACRPSGNKERHWSIEFELGDFGLLGGWSGQFSDPSELTMSLVGFVSDARRSLVAWSSIVAPSIRTVRVKAAGAAREFETKPLAPSGPRFAQFFPPPEELTIASAIDEDGVVRSEELLPVPRFLPDATACVSINCAHTHRHSPKQHHLIDATETALDSASFELSFIPPEKWQGIAFYSGSLGSPSAPLDVKFLYLDSLASPTKGIEVLNCDGEYVNQRGDEWGPDVLRPHRDAAAVAFIRRFHSGPTRLTIPGLLRFPPLQIPFGACSRSALVGVAKFPEYMALLPREEGRALVVIQSWGLDQSELTDFALHVLPLNEAMRHSLIRSTVRAIQNKRELNAPKGFS